MRTHHREIQRWRSRLFEGLNESESKSLWTPVDISSVCTHTYMIVCVCQGYQWLKERVHSEEGRRQQAKIKELHLVADRLGCTAAQLAIGKTQHTRHALLSLKSTLTRILHTDTQKVVTAFSSNSCLAVETLFMPVNGTHLSPAPDAHKSINTMLNCTQSRSVWKTRRNSLVASPVKWTNPEAYHCLFCL